MDRTSVDSSNITSVVYDSDHMILEIEFSNGRIYRYTKVPQKVYDGFLDASSKGTYFHKYIKPHNFTYKRIK